MVVPGNALKLISVAICLAGLVATATLPGARPESGNWLSGDFEHLLELLGRPELPILRQELSEPAVDVERTWAGPKDGVSDILTCARSMLSPSSAAS